MGGAGIAADDQGFIFVSTGNGDADSRHRQGRLSQAVLKLDTAGGKLALTDWYMAGNYGALNSNGSGSGLVGGVDLAPTEPAAGVGQGRARVPGRQETTGPFPRRRQPGPEDQGRRRNRPDRKSQFGGYVYWEGPDGPAIFSWPAASKILGFE